MRVGADVESICRKCGVTWHVVIALAEGRIAKAECGECGARHAYRPPGGVKTSARAVRTGAAAPRSGGATRKPARKAIVEADPARPPRPFRVSDTYRAGDRVVHASFGEGVVQASLGPTKVEVLFGSGARILVHGRKG